MGDGKEMEGKEMEGKEREGALHHPAAPHQVLTSAAASSTNQSISVCCNLVEAHCYGIGRTGPNC